MLVFKRLRMPVTLSVFVCAHLGSLKLTGESDWEVYEEVSAALRQSCCDRSQSGSPGSQISVNVFEVRLKPVCEAFVWSITNFTVHSAAVPNWSNIRVNVDFLFQNENMTKV